MNKDDFIKEVAAELGPEVLEATDPDKEQERALGSGEAFMVAGFLAQLVQIALTLWQIKQGQAQQIVKIATHEKVVNTHPSLDPEKRADVMARVFAKLSPGDFGHYLPDASSSKDITPQQLEDKTKMLRGLLTDRGEDLDSFLEQKTRDFAGGVPILIPFADQYWWIVTNELHWIPDASDGPAVVRSDIPKNFVCDLASVPRYLWSFLPKTGQYGLGAIHHDWLCWEQNCSRKQADDTFYAIMGDMGVSDETRTAIYWGCRIFGGSYWSGNTKAKENGDKRLLKSIPTDPSITWDEWKKNPDVFVS